MRVFWGVLIVTFFVVCWEMAASAADMAFRIKARYDDLQAFSATFEQILVHKESGSKEKRQGRLLFQKPLRIRWQTEKPHEETLVVTAKEIWDYLPDDGVAYRYPRDLVQDSRSIIQVVTGQAALTKDFDVKNEGEEKGLVKLRLYPKEPTSQMVEARLWVDPITAFIRRASIVDFYGNINEVRFIRFQPDVAVKSADFVFIPPKGVEVEDRTDSTVQERELFK